MKKSELIMRHSYLKLITASVATILISFSCVKFPQPDPVNPISDIPTSFNWKTIQDVKISIGVNSVAGISDNFIRVIKVYSSPLLKDGSLILSGAAKPGSPLNTTITLPSALKSIYVEEILPNGSRTLTKTDITSSNISVNSTAAVSSKSNAQVVNNASFVSPSIAIPANYDVVINNNNSLSLSGFTSSQSSAYGNQYKSYLIPAGFNRTSSINAGNNNGHVILYVKGKYTTSATANLNKTTIVVLDGGEVSIGGLETGTIDAGIPVLYVQQSGSLYSGKSMNFSSASIIVNKGVITVNNNIDLNTSSTFYNEGQIIISKRASGVLVTNNSALYNSGTVDVKRFDVTTNASFTNDTYGLLRTETYYQSNGTVVNNHHNIVATTSFKASGGGTVNNFCNITANLTDLQGFTANLYEGSLWSTQSFAVNITNINMNGGSIFMTGNINSVWDMSLKSTYDSYSLFKVTGNIPDLRYAGSEVSGRVEFVHTLMTEGTGTNGRQLYQSMFTDGLSLLSKNQTKNILASSCNDAAGQIVAPPPAITDNDGDGVAEEFDFNDNDANVAFVSYFPSETSWGTYAFEDTWSWKGDYDMNDLVLAFRVTYFTNAANKVTSMKFDHKILASGSGMDIAAAIQLDKVNSSNVTTVTGQDISGTAPFAVTANGTETGMTLAVVPLFNSVRHIVTEDFGVLLNTVEGTQINTPEKSFKINFTNPVEMNNLTMEAINFFIIPNQSGLTQRGKEIHLPTFLPTAKADMSLFNGKQLHPSDKYKFEDGMMWGIMIPDKFEYPLEYSQVDMAYLNFFNWAKSNGTEHTDWYKNLDGYRDETKIYGK